MLMVALVLAGIPFVLSLTGGALGRFGDFVFGIAILVATAAAIPVAAGAYADVPPDWRGAAGFGLQKLGPILAAGIVTAIILVLAGIPFLLSLAGGDFGWIGNPAFWVAIVVAALAVTLVTSGAYADVLPDWWGAAGFGLQKKVPILAAVIVFGVMVFVDFLGFVALIVLGIILLVSFSWFDAVLMIERTGPMQSLGRSWRLVSGERWRVLLVGLGFLIITFMIFMIIGLILFFLLRGLLGASDNFAIYLSGQIVNLLGIPLVAAFSTVIYLDLRVRKEHLDKEGLAAQLSSGA